MKRSSWVVVAALLGLTACGTGAPTSVGSASSAAAAPDATPSPARVVPLAQVCGAVPVPAGVEQRALPLPSGTALSTAWAGRGTTVAVLLHQTDGNGLCGFLFYADVLVRQGVRVALVDLCGYGQSACVEAQPGSGVVEQVGAVVAQARDEGARRVVLVGASMGGSVALTTAGPVRADGLVDLSGPAEFHTSDVERDAPSVTMPALFAFGELTDPADLLAVQDALPAMPTRRKKVVTLEDGHGYALLSETGTDRPTALSRAVVRFVKTGRLP
jgi:pimeloyl-ACP methyl ester carboxylesterase